MNKIFHSHSFQVRIASISGFCLVITEASLILYSIFILNQNAVEQTNAATLGMIGMAGFLLILSLILIWVMVGMTISQPLACLANQAALLASGKKEPKGGETGINLRSDEIGTIAKALSSLQEFHIQICAAAQTMAGGNLKLNPATRGENDDLGNSLAELTCRLQTMLLGVKQNTIIIEGTARQLDHDSIQTALGSEQIMKTIRRIADTTSQQSDEIFRLSASLSNLEPTTDRIRTVSEGQIHSITQAILAMGDLSISIEKYNACIENQTTSTRQNRDILEELDSAVNRLMNGAEIQNQGLNQATGTYIRLSNVIKAITHFIRDTAQDTEKIARQANEGMAVIEKTSHSMEEVRRGTTSLSTSIDEMSQRTNQISKIVATIKEIAGQTNLIALNAAIEAARSGSQVKTIAEDLLTWQILVQCHIFGDLLACEDTRSWDKAQWAMICKRAGVDTFLATDADGVVTISNQTDVFNWRFPEDPKEQAFVFRQLIYRNDGVVVQKFQPRSIDGKMYKWVGISRRDEPGIIQIGLSYEISRLSEQSGGFSVLAQEVRKLAEKAAAASGEITQIIQTVQTGAKETVEAMQKTGKDINAASELTARAQEAFIGIVQETISSTERVHAAQGAINEMETTSEDLNKAVSSAHAIAQENLIFAADISRMSSSNAAQIEKILRIGEENKATAANTTTLKLSIVGMLENLRTVTQQNETAIQDMLNGLKEMRERIEMTAKLSEGNRFAVEQASTSAEDLNAQAKNIIAASHALLDVSHNLQHSIEYFGK